MFTFSGLFWPGSFFPSFRLWIRKRCKGVHCVDLGESIPTSIYLKHLAYSCSEQCATTIRYRTFNALYHSCSTAFSVLEESGQVYFSCTRIPGSLLFFFFLREGLDGVACLLASIQPRTSPTKTIPDTPIPTPPPPLKPTLNMKPNGEWNLKLCGNET